MSKQATWSLKPSRFHHTFILIIIIIKTLFQEGNTISTELISLAALKYLQIYIVDEWMKENEWMNEMNVSDRWHDISDFQAHIKLIFCTFLVSIWLVFDLNYEKRKHKKW